MRVLRVAGAILFVALLAAPADAQNAVPRYGDTDKSKTPSEVEAEKQAEKAYKNSLRNIPEKAPTDPWGNVRSDNAPKAAAKSATRPSAAKQQPKTDANAK